VSTAGSLDACRASLRERMPVEAAEALVDIGYDRFVDDVCAGLAALRERSVAGCDALSVSPLRRGCRRRLALLEGSPDLCPDDPVFPGREAMCLALAAHDSGLCRGTPRAERVRCRAIVDNDADHCARDVEEGRERCRAEVRRYGPVIAGESQESEAGNASVEFRLEVRTVPPRGRPGDPVIVERDVLDMGVYVRTEGCTHRVTFSNPLGEVPSAGVLAGRSPTATLEITLPAQVALPLHLPLGTAARLEVTVPGVGQTSSIAGATGKATVVRWSTERGGIVEVRIDGDLALVPGRLLVEGVLRTFVRDVDPLSEGCSAQAP